MTRTLTLKSETLTQLTYGSSSFLTPDVARRG